MTIAPDDRGFTLGDGLFETLLVEDGQPADWTAHIARLTAGCAALGLPAPAEPKLHAAVRQALSTSKLWSGRAALRLSWSAGPGGRGLDRPQPLAPVLTATLAPASWPPGPVTLATAQVRRNEGSPASRHKTLSYIDNILARQEAVATGADDALMLNNRGEIACASAANIFWVRDGQLCTPALECGVLAGIVRARVLVADLNYQVRQVREPRGELDSAEAIFLTNSLVGVRDVSALDGRPLPQQVGQSILKALRGRR